MPPARRSRVKLLDEEEEEPEVTEEDNVDLNQTADEKRQVRNKIQEITSALESYRKSDKSLRDSDDKFGDILEDAKQLVKIIKDPQEQLEDAKMFYTLCRVFSELSSDMDGNEQKFTPSDYCANAARAMQASGDTAPFRPSKANLINFGRKISENFKHAPTFTFLLGTLNTESVGGSQQRRVKKKAVGNKAKEKAPTQMSTVGKYQTVEALTDKYVKEVKRCLEKAFKDSQQKPICYFSFVIDPDNFGKTVENMFHVSFLIRQRIAELSIGESGMPILSPKVKKGGAKAGRRRGGGRGDSDSEGEEEGEDSDSGMDQAVMDICLDDWIELKENLNIKKAMISSST